MIDKYLSPKELQRLISALLVVCTLIVMGLFFAFMVVPGIRNVNNRVVDPAVSVPQGQTGWLDPTDYPAERGKVIPPVDPATVMTANADLVARGKNLYTQSCASCHGATGKGDGPAGLGLNPKPRNLTAGEGWKNSPQLTGIFKTLTEGLKGTSMVAYNHISKKDRMALAHYIQSLATFPHPTEDPAALAALTKLFASAGEVIPNRIPVSAAIHHLLEETRPVRPLVLNTPMLQASVADARKAARLLQDQPTALTTEATLSKAVLAGLPANGFTPRVATYTAAQWKTLRSELATAR